MWQWDTAASSGRYTHLGACGAAGYQIVEPSRSHEQGLPEAMLLRKVTFNKEAFLISHFSKRGGNLRNPGKPLGNPWETPQKHYSFFRFGFKNAGNCAGNPRNPWETQHFVDETFGNPFGTMHIHPPSETLFFLWIGLQKRLQLWRKPTETSGKPLRNPTLCRGNPKKPP